MPQRTIGTCFCIIIRNAYPEELFRDFSKFRKLGIVGLAGS